MSMSFTPLRGVRILDLSRILAGPYCSMTLADLGAEVIKVERPHQGDDTRRWGPPFLKANGCKKTESGNGDDAESVYFLSVNRNKKSICLDLKSEEGRKLIMEKLVPNCDVLMENFLPGAMEKMGLGYETLSRQWPRLIYASISGYGTTGPYKGRGGYDVVASALAGLTHITGPSDGDPCRVGVAMTDIATGLYVHGAIMGALFNRERTGKGVKIEGNLLSTQVACNSHIGANWLNTGAEAKRYGTGHGSIVPYQAFPTSDSRFLIVGAGNDAHFVSLCRLLSLPDLGSDPRFATNQDRVVNRSALIPLLNERFAQEPLSHWLEVFQGCALPYGPVNTMEQVFQDPQVEHNRIVWEYQHPIVGRVRVPGHPVVYRTPYAGKGTTTEQKVENGESVSDKREMPEEEGESNVSPAPMLGEHTDWVLENVAGCSAQEIQRLRDISVVT